MRRLILLALLLLFVPHTVSAQENLLLISPLRSNYTAQPGSTVRTSITLQNPTNKPMTVTIVARDFEASKELDGQPSFIENGTSPYGISNWFAGANLEKKLTVPANQKIGYEAIFRVPAGVTPRTYFGSVTFIQEVGTSVGSLVFITIGNPETKLNIESLSFGESHDATKPHGIFTTIIKNTSEGLSTPRFKLKITDGAGKTVLELDQDGEGSVLPNSSRRFTFTPSAELPNELLTATVTAVDQNGTTADKSIQLDRELTRFDGISAGKPKDDKNLLIPVLVAAAVVVVVGILLVIKCKRTPVPSQVAIPEIQNTTPQEDPNEKYTNFH